MGKVSFLQSDQFEDTFKRLFKDCRKFYCAVAWGRRNPCLKCVQYPKKVKMFVVGTDFYQTTPDFLRLLYKSISSRLRVMRPNQSGTFHPKVYLFVNDGDDAVAIVGSANFTNAAMSGNKEAMLIFKTTCNDECFTDLLDFVRECYRKADVVNDDFMNLYRDKWKVNQSHISSLRSSLRQFKLPRRITVAKRLPDPIQMTWQEFAKKVKEEKNSKNENRLSERLDVLKNARDLFNKAKTFSGLREIERKALAGTIGKNEKKELEQNKATTEWWSFGTMRGSGVFQHLVNNEPKYLSLALKAIPPFPNRIEERDYENFITNFKKASEKKARRPRINCASRLLAMKRPDYFVCFNNENKKGLCEQFGVKQASVNLDTYWNLIINPMHQSNWWNTRRPKGKDGDIWKGRAALLDAIYY